MTPGDLLHQLRGPGYTVRRRGDDLNVRGPVPRGEQDALGLLTEDKPALLKLLDVEQDPAVQTVLSVFPGARLVEVRQPKATRSSLPTP